MAKYYGAYYNLFTTASVHIQCTLSCASLQLHKPAQLHYVFVVLLYTVWIVYICVGHGINKTPTVSTTIT